MFSSKFLSGGNPLSAVSSAVNKFGLFGDDQEGEKSQKPPQQQAAASTGKGPPQEQQQRNQGQNGQNATGQSNGGPQAAKGQQQGTAKPGGPQAQQSKSGTVEQASKTAPKMQQKEPTKTDGVSKPGVQQGQAKVGGSPGVGGSPNPAQKGPPSQGGMQGIVGQKQASPKPGSQQGSPNVGRQQQGMPKPGQPGGQTQGSPKPGQQGSPKPPAQQGPPKPGLSGSPGQQRTGSASPAVGKAGAKSKICSVCNSTELNVNTKEPPNYKTCTQCKTEVCSLCGFSPPDSSGKEWLCLTCQIQRAQGPDPSGPSMKKPPPSSTQKSPVPVKKDIAQSSSPLKSQPMSGPTKSEPPKDQKPDTSPQPGRKPAGEPPQQQSGGLFGFGASKTDSGTSKESVTGKMFGFGSSFLSSASTLISSDETKVTPPVSPKVQPANQAKKAEPEKKQEPTKAGAKVEKSDPAKDKAALLSLKDVPFTCPLCHTGLNQASGKPNYCMCTDCRGIVCDQCGFNPTPNVKEGNEWLCLNCQVKRSRAPEPEVKKMPSAQPAPQKTSSPASPQRKPQPTKTEGTKAPDKDGRKEPTQPPGPKPTQDPQPKKTDQTAPKSRSASPAPPQQDSGGGFFGFGGPKSQPDTAKPAESVTGKMFGFGSSILSSASTLMTTESKTTPPVSPKISKESKQSPSPAAKKQEAEKKAEEGKGQPKEQTKPPVGKSACPLCKVQLNAGSKEPPNYNTCTECKSVVCNQCGFSPMPNVKEVKEWLCLNCQMQRALSASEQPAMPTKKPQASPNKAPTPAATATREPSPANLKKDIPQPTKPQSSPTPGSPQRRPTTAQQQGKPDTEKQRQGSPAAVPKAQDVGKPGESKPPQVAPAGPKPQAEATKPSDSIGGKMFGFGSSIFSSASSMISSAVQDESKTTPPVSPKMPTAKTTKSPQTQRKDEEDKKKPGQVNQPNATSLPQAKVEKAPPQPVKEQTAPAASKAAPSNCPLCKVRLNVGSKDLPNYNRCTQCKETVCNQCGFNPVPNVTEAKEWLCLNCQMQRALAASEDKTPTMKSPNVANKASKPAEAMKKDVKDSPVPIKKTPSPAEPQLKPDSRIQKDQKPPQKPEPQKDQVDGKKDTPVTAESVTGKMFGFGSSIFSSASSLISSAESTPPTSRKMSTPGQASPQSSPGPKVAPKQATEAERQKPDAKDLESKIQQPPQKTEQKPMAEAKQNQAVADGQKDTTSKVPPESKPTESVTGKMFGFGSSILSSASSLISSAESTPPSSRKMSTPGQASPQSSPGPKVAPKQLTEAEQRKPDAKDLESKTQQPPETTQQKPMAEVKQNQVEADAQKDTSSKAPPEAKPTESVTGKMFGFGSSILSSASSLISSAESTPPSSRKMSTPGQGSPQSSPGPKVPSKQPTEVEGRKGSVDSKGSSPIHVKKTPAAPQAKPAAKDMDVKKQQNENLPPKTEHKPQPEVKQNQAVTDGQKEAPSKAPPESKPTESVTGKMFGFGSSILSSATSLISSAESTPPSSRKMSTPGQASPQSLPGPKVAPKQADSKSSSPVHTKKTPVDSQAKPDAKAMESQIQQDQKVPQKAEQKHQPEVKQNQVVTDGQKDTPSQALPESKATESVTGKMFGFGSSILSSASSLISSAESTPPSSRKMSTPGQASPQSSPGPKVAPKQPTEVKESVPGPIKAPATPQPKAAAPGVESQVKQDQKPPQKVEQPKSEPKKDQVVSDGQKEAPPKTIPEAKTTESVTGKMFGFGSSIFSSASTLISSVQDESRTTPPSSRKMSAPAQASPKTSPGPKITPKQTPQTEGEKENVIPKGATPVPVKAAADLQAKPDTSATDGKPKQDPAVAQKAQQPKPEPKKEQTATDGQKDAPPKVVPEAKTTESVTGKMFGFGSSIFSSASTLISSVQDESRTTPPSSRKMSAPAQGSPKTSPGPKVVPKQIPDKEGGKENVDPKGSSTVPVKTVAEPQLKQDASATDGKPKQDPAVPQKAEQPKPEPKKEQAVTDGPKDTPPQVVPEAKTTESVTGKMFGFGSSIFSSASTLISSVQDESRTTPPASRKMSAPAQASPKSSPGPKVAPKQPTPTGSPKRDPKAIQKADEEQKKSVPPQVKDAKLPSPAPKANDCPLCKTKLNIGSKDAPNYSTCTECKETVCSQCGFSPVPMGEVKEWLCLNCQMKRAAAVPEPPRVIKSPSKAPAAGQKKDSAMPEKKDVPVPVSLKKTPEPQPQKAGPPAVDKKETVDQKTPQPKPQKGPDQGTPPLRRQSKEQESGGFFGFGGPKAQPESEKPAESVGGKMFGFGSSIFSSASTLITSAVQDQPRTTPPVSPKLSPAKPAPAADVKTQKPDEQKKEEAKTAPATQPRADKVPPQPTKTTTPSPAPAVKPGQSACPLCKAQLNINTKDPPNYSNCTECKNTVCKQCGFNPSPNDLTGKEWLCLNCQMQRALSMTEAPNKLPEKVQKKEPTPVDAGQKKPLPAVEKAADVDVAKSKQESPAPAQKKPQEPVKTPDQTRRPSTASAKSQEDSGGIFGFGAKAQPDSKPAESVSGKMFGFGSSLFSSASTLIASAVQDQPSTTPPASPKMSPAKDVKGPPAQKAEQEKKPDQPQQTKTPPITKPSSPAPPKKAVSQDVTKIGENSCPLCKAQLNVGSKEAPNYNSCTECKNRVCNQCGFSPMPTNESQIKEWLCLTCQMQRALKQSEEVQPPMKKPLASPNKVPSPAPGDRKNTPPTQKVDVSEKMQKDVTQKKPEEAKAPSKIPTTNIPASLPEKQIPTAKDIKDGIPPKVPVSDAKAPLEIATPTKVPESKEPKKEDSKPTEKIQTQPDTRKGSKTEETGGFFGFGSPKSQRSASVVPEPVSGKVMGFGSSLFSSASSLISSAVKDEPRTTPPGTRKMSAPVQAADKTSPSKVSPKPSPPVSPKIVPPKDAKPAEAPKPVDDKVQKVVEKGVKVAEEVPKQDSPKPDVKVGPTSCPLCKVEINVSAKDGRNYNTCTQCKSVVCSKCGFSPMPTVSEVKEWLCLNCQMQRALGASEPPGLPMMKPSPKKEVPPTPPTKDTVPEPIAAKKDAEKPKVEETKLPVEAPPIAQEKAVPLQPEKAAPIRKPSVPEVESLKKPVPSGPTPPPGPVKEKEQPTKPVPSTVTPVALKGPAEEKPPTTAPLSGPVDVKTPKAIPAEASPAVSRVPEAAKPPAVELPKPSVKPAAPPVEAKATTELPPKPTPTKVSPVPTKEPVVGKPLPSADKPVPPEPSPKPEVKAVGPTGPAQAKTTPQQPPSPKPSPKPAAEAKVPPAQAAKPAEPGAKTVPPTAPQVKPAQPPAQPAKQESGGFFGFGSKPQPAAQKPAESVGGKMFGFGSSFLSSASNLISSAVQEEPKTTPPTPRKMSATQVSPKATPPASPKPTPAAAQKVDEKKPQEKAPAVPVKVEKVTPEPSKTPPPAKGAPKTEKSACPLCKVELNMGSKDSPNYNTCTECKKTVCNQCGFNPTPNVTEVKEWLCLDCQMKRALGPTESTGLPAMKPKAPVKEQDKPLIQKEKPPDVQVKKEIVSPTPAKKEVPKVEPTPAAVPPPVPVRKGSLPKPQATPMAPQAKDITEKQPPTVGKPAQPTPPAKPDTKEAPTKRDEAKPAVQQPPKPATPPVNAPAPAQPPKQESGGFFGFGSPKTQPKSETVTGKMFGFGSSFLSSASTLITSAVQDEPKTTPPVSPKLSPVKPKPEQQPSPTKTTPPVEKKVEKVPAEPPKDREGAAKAGPSTCPLCKVELNVGSKDSPNYNTCTECKNRVCNLCGFNPMPHTAAKEWLCLNCQTQRALSGQLGDPGKMPQPAPTSVKAETQATPPVKKPEPKPTPAETKPAPPPVKPKPETAPKPQTPPLKPKAEVKAIPTPEKLPDGKPVPPAKPTNVTPEKKIVDVPIEATTEAKKEAEKPVVSVRDITKKYELSEKPKVEIAAPPAPATPTKATVTPVSTAPKSEMAEVVPVAQKKPSEVITLAKDTKAVKDEAKVQEPFPKTKIEPVSAVEAKGAEIKKPAVVKAEKDVTKEPVKDEPKPSTTTAQAKVKISPVTTTVQPKAHEENLPQILPITEELKDTKVISDANENTIKQEEQLAAKEEVKTERRRLSFQAMEESSESERTPSPKIQRRRLRVTRISSSSEESEMKTESADSSGEDEEFIRKQIMGMRDEEQMSLSEDEKDKEAEDMVCEVVVDNAATVTKPSQPVSESERAVSMVEIPAQTTPTFQEVKEVALKKATPAMRQRQSTDEEVESITESLSKGSSSVQASSFTPGSSPTSASSIEEDSDSSPSHRKAEKQHRKGKHRQPTQPLPTIEDSSEEERMKDEERSRREKDGDVSSSDELRQVTIVGDRTSGSDRSASVESADRQTVQRGRKPSPTVIPFTPEPVQQTLTRTLKSADEAYEEILLKAKAIPGESPPDIEPMFGGMPIEDYLYESLVEEPEKIRESEELRVDVTEPSKKLRSPEEVYEEMMAKKRELIMIEQELQEAQILLEASAAAEPESCVVTMPTEEPSSPPLVDEGDEVSSDMQVKKKKRPAPPRPTEPPKRPNGATVHSHPTGISFVRPMLPQDPSLAKALFPIPHLKITQCSSGEEEEDSLADEYGVGMSSDITPSDDSDAKEPSPPLSETAEMEPISVVCEIPEARPIPTPISAPELTSPVSTVSPPTSPATPESSLATSSSSYQAQTPPSLDSTPISTPTPPTSVVTQSPPFITDHALSTVVVTVPDVVQKDKVKDKPEPSIVQMPDLVSSPSQVPVETSAVTQVAAATVKPSLVSAQSATQTVTPKVGPTAAVRTVSRPVGSSGSPVIVQMPDLVSTASPAVSAIVTIPSQAPTAVAQSVPGQPVVPSVSPTPAISSTTIVKRKVPPPPPPRSTSVSLPDDRQRASPAITTVTAATPKPTQPMQSVVVDIQPRIDAGANTTQLVTPTRQGHVMIIVPSKENAALQNQTQEGITTTSLPPTAQTITQVSVSTKVAAPPVPPKPVLSRAASIPTDTVEIAVADTPPPAPATLPRPHVSPKPHVPSVSATTTTISTTEMIAPVTTSAPSQAAKPPPPIPPKPVAIPAGLVFSHKPGESVKPPYAMPKAATLPRTKEPPNALSLSITRPVESKSGATSPKSPVSPRYAKCKETYVVITLPSEPAESGSPPEGITVMAPVRRGSTPSTKVSEVRATPAEQKTTEIYAAKAAPRRASMPSVRYPSPTPPAPIVVVEQLPSKVVSAEKQPKPVPAVRTVIDAPALPIKDAPIQVQSVPMPIKKPYMQLVEQQAITQPLPAPEVIVLSSEPVVPIQPQTVQVTARAQPISTEKQPIKAEPTAPPTVDTKRFAAAQPVDVYLNMQDTDVPISAAPQIPQVEAYIEIQKEYDISREVTPDIHIVAGPPPVIDTKQEAVILMPPPTAAEVRSAIEATVQEATPPSMLIGVQQMRVQPTVPSDSYVQDNFAATTPPVMQPPTPPLEVIALPYERLTGVRSEDVRSTPLPTAQPQTVIPVEVITADETRRRSSIPSAPQPIFVTSQTVPYELPPQMVKSEEYATARRESITRQQLPQKDEVVYMSTERDVSIDMPERLETKPVFISEYDTQMEDGMFGRRPSIPTRDIPQAIPGAPVTITKIQQESIESQEIRGQEKVVSSMSHMYSSQISTSAHPPESMPSLVTQVVTTEVQRTTVSVVHERIPPTPPNVAITIQPELVRATPPPKQNGRVYPVDVIDLRTMRDGVKMTEQGMDLTPSESGRQSVSSDSSGRQITAVQPEIVNLSAEITPSTTLAVVTDSITIVTCSATIASYTPAEKPLDLQGSVTSAPLPLTTYKPFEPLAQIVYRPVSAITPTTTVTPAVQDTPMNLSYGAIVSSPAKPPTSPSAPVICVETNGAIDLSNYKPMRAIVTLKSTSPGVTTTVIEDDDTPIDLTAGRSVCCDVIYKLPFTGVCQTQPAVTTQPDAAGLYSIKGMNGMKVSLSETNIPEVALVPYDPTKHLDYLNGASDSAIDLTATKLSAGKPMDYTSKAAGAYPGMPTSPYGPLSPAAGFGVNSSIRTSDGMVYTSVAAPVPSTYAITTQPGSIFSTTLSPVTTSLNQALVPYQLIPTTDPGQIIPYDTGLPKELLPTALADIITGYQEMYSDTTLEAIAASLDALATSPIFPGLDSTKMAQYQMEREFLELEKLKQICLAEELEWERQEIQRYREQEQIMVQRELEELQALKQQLLLQQEEEHHAHMVAQQETYAQQKEQLQQIQQLQLQLQRQLDEHYGTNTAHLLEAKYAGVGDSGQYWPVKDESSTAQLQGSQDQLNIKKLQADQDIGKKIIDSGVHTDDEDSEKQATSSLRRKKTKRTSDSSPPTDDEDDWDAPTKSRRRSRKHSSDGRHGSKVSSIAIQTVAEISVQTDHSGTIKKPSVQMDTKVEIIKHISAPENSQRGGSLSCQTERHVPVEMGYSTHLTADGPCKTKVFYGPVSPLSPEKSLGGQRMLMADPNRFSSGPRSLKPGQKSLSDPKSLSPTTDDRMGYYGDGYSGRGSPSSTGKKVKRTLPDPPPEEDSMSARSGYSTNSARRRLARSTTMARAKILQDIDKELDLVERESSKLRKKQAELDEEEKEIDAKLRYLEMGINRRKEALLQEREKRERAYLQGVAEERDYMSDSEVSNIREERGEGMERPRTAPQSEFDQFIPPQTEADSQYNTLTSPYSHYAQYVPQTQTTSPYTQQGLYQQQSLYHQQVSPYQSVPTLSLSQAQSSSYQHALLLQQGKQRQTTLSDLEPKIATNYEVIRNQPLLIVPTSSESGYGVAPLGSKFASLDLRIGLEERSMASSPMSSISADSFYADIDHHNARNYVLIEDIGELTKASSGLGSSGFSLPDKELSKADRLLRAAEVRRTAEMADFLGSSRLQGYSKGEDDTMEEPYELKLLKQQIKQEFRRGTEGLEHLTGLGLPQYLHSDPTFRHFPKGEKYSIGRLTLEKQAAKQLPASVLYQKQMKNKKAVLDPKAISKCSPIQESRDLEPDFASYMGSGASSVTNLAARARLLQDEITFGLRKNLAEQQKYLGSSLGANLASSLNLGQNLGLGAGLDGTYPSGSRSRPSSRPSSVYGLDLSIKRDLSSSSLRLKPEGDVLDAAFAPGVARTKPTSLPISQSRGRIPIVAQNSEEESPLSPVGQPMGMARASAGPLPPISADTRDQFGSSHSLPEVQQHMREESRTRGYDRDIAFIMDDLQGAMSDSEAYHLRREDTDWFDKPREGHPQSGHMDRRQMKLVPYAFPHARIKLKRDQRDCSVSGNGLGIRVVGGKEIPGSRGEIGAYIAAVIPGGAAEQTGKVIEGMQVLEWNAIPLTGKTYEEVQCIVGQPCAEAELCVRLDLNMLSDPERPQLLEHQLQTSGQRSPGVDPKQLAAELQKVSQLQGPGMAGAPMGSGGLGVLSALERSALLQSGPGSAASSGVPSPGQPASPAINKKQRHKTEVARTPHPITGEIQLQINYDRNLGNLIVHVLQARNLAPRDNDGYSDPFVKVYLLPGRGADNKRRTRYAQKTVNPEWNQTVIYKNIHLEQLKKKTLEVTVWDYDRSSSNDFLGEVLIDLSNTAQLDNVPRWLPLKEQSESIEHSRAHLAQGPPGAGGASGPGQGHLPGTGTGPSSLGHSSGQGDGSHDSPKNSVIKSRSHGIFPDPAKDMQMLPLEKSHSSPGSSKSSSEGQLLSHGPSRSQSKSSVTQAHLEDAGMAIAAAEAAVQQSRLQPRTGHRLADVSSSVVLSAPSLVGDAYGDEDGAGSGVDSAIFQVPRMKAIPNGTDKHHIVTPENEGGKVQVMGEIKVALKKEVKTEGDQLVLEILQCRNITYKFKSPDHLPDLYVKLYVVNVATQKRIIKKKTRVCRHDREPSFNETFRFPLNPTGHSIQLFLVSNGGKFMKKTLIGEAYIWLDKVDMRKRVVSWHKLLASTALTNP